MKYADIKNQSKSELYKELGMKKEKLFMLKVKNQMDQLSNPLEIRFLRRDIAKISTAINCIK